MNRAELNKLVRKLDGGHLITASNAEEIEEEHARRIEDAQMAVIRRMVPAESRKRDLAMEQERALAAIPTIDGKHAVSATTLSPDLARSLSMLPMQAVFGRPQPMLALGDNQEAEAGDEEDDGGVPLPLILVTPSPSASRKPSPDLAMVPRTTCPLCPHDRSFPNNRALFEHMASRAHAAKTFQSSAAVTDALSIKRSTAIKKTDDRQFASLSGLAHSLEARARAGGQGVIDTATAFVQNALKGLGMGESLTSLLRR